MYYTDPVLQLRYTDPMAISYKLVTLPSKHQSSHPIHLLSKHHPPLHHRLESPGQIAIISGALFQYRAKNDDTARFFPEYLAEWSSGRMDNVAGAVSHCSPHVYTLARRGVGFHSAPARRAENPNNNQKRKRERERRFDRCVPLIWWAPRSGSRCVRVHALALFRGIAGDSVAAAGFIGERASSLCTWARVFVEVLERSVGIFGLFAEPSRYTDLFVRRGRWCRVRAEFLGDPISVRAWSVWWKCRGRSAVVGRRENLFLGGLSVCTAIRWRIFVWAVGFEEAHARLKFVK